MEYEYRKVVETVVEFKKLLQQLEQMKSMLNDEIEEADKAFCDIRHYVENGYPIDSKNKTKVCRLMKTYSDRRRQAKDMENLLEPLVNDFAANVSASKNISSFLNMLGRVSNEMEKRLKRLEAGDRKYTPRVLDELFTEEE